jgi:uncharacterized protein (TIGR02246 family)
MGGAMNAINRIGAIAVVLVVVGCARQPAAAPETRAAEEATIRANVKEWSAAAQAKDAEKFASFYAADGVIMLEDAPDISGMEAIREGLGGMMQDPNFALSFEADTVVVARSGDLAYETGAYTMAMTGADKAPATEQGHYVVVWRKQADGAWKVALDAPLSDPPAGAATPVTP